MAQTHARARPRSGRRCSNGAAPSRRKSPRWQRARRRSPPRARRSGRAARHPRRTPAARPMRWRVGRDAAAPIDRGKPAWPITALAEARERRARLEVLRRWRGGSAGAARREIRERLDAAPEALGELAGVSAERGAGGSGRDGGAARSIGPRARRHGPGQSAGRERGRRSRGAPARRCSTSAPN